jgi:hypothetical protein
MLIALIFTACLSASPTSCQRVELTWEGSMQECALFAQQRLAAWQQEHPQLRVGRFRCTFGRPV